MEYKPLVWEILVVLSSLEQRRADIKIGDTWAQGMFGFCVLHTHIFNMCMHMCMFSDIYMCACVYIHISEVLLFNLLTRWTLVDPMGCSSPDPLSTDSR